MAHPRDSAPVKARMATVSDLVVLVLGVALALSMMWHSNWSGEPAMPWVPRWRDIGGFVEEAVEKSCLALIPLALWRRARLGGVCRPSELLLVVCATPGIVFDLNWAVWNAEGRPGIDYGADLGDTFWRIRAIAWSIALSALLGLFLGRGRLGDFARSVLLVVVVAASFPWLLDALDNVEMVAVETNQLDGWSEVAVAVACGAIKFLVPGIIGAAAVLDMMRRRGRADAMEWSGLTLATIVLVIALPVNLWGNFMPSIPPLRDIHLHAMYFGGPIVAAILGSVGVATLGPGWSRAFGPARANSGPAKDAEAVA